jgi:hypothetical protein
MAKFWFAAFKDGDDILRNVFVQAGDRDEARTMAEGLGAEEIMDVHLLGDFASRQEFSDFVMMDMANRFQANNERIDN